MFKYLAEKWRQWAREGIHLPYAFDPETQKPSITLMFYWITSFLAVISLILFHLGKVAWSATATSVLFVLMGFIMYRLRKLDKVKIDVDDQSIELEGDDDKSS